MKRHGNLFERITNIDNLSTAYLKARVGKTTRECVKKFETSLDARLDEIRRSLIDRTFTASMPHFWPPSAR
jgi:hypothetical protein